MTAPSSVVLPVGDAIAELLYLLYDMSLGENPVQLWTSVGGAIGVASSLEASLLEIEVGLRKWCVVNGGGRRPRVGVDHWVEVTRSWLGWEMLRDHGCC